LPACIQTLEGNCRAVTLAAVWSGLGGVVVDDEVRGRAKLRTWESYSPHPAAVNKSVTFT